MTSPNLPAMLHAAENSNFAGEAALWAAYASACPAVSAAIPASSSVHLTERQTEAATAWARKALTAVGAQEVAA